MEWIEKLYNFRKLKKFFKSSRINIRWNLDFEFWIRIRKSGIKTKNNKIRWFQLLFEVNLIHNIF